jgi:Trypsin-like peptidase domain
MSQCLEDLLQQCTVKLTISGVSYGTGFFVSPGLILTCAHVVKDLGHKSIQVRWQSQGNWAQAVVERSILDPHDLALLRVVSRIDTNPPCVFLDGKILRQRDPLYLFGYPDKDFPNGCPVTFDYEGLTGDAPALIKFKSGLVRPGMSGSPLLNQRTGDVCGIVKFTLDRASVRGGGAIPTSVILNQFPELVEKQRSFHRQDRRWNNLAGELFDDEGVTIQNNFDDTQNYQVQTGANNNTYIGVGVVYNNISSPEQQMVRNILVLPANPDTTEISHKRIGIQKLRAALKRANYGQMFKLEDRLETNAADIAQVLTEIEPYIVNISGHEDGVECIALKDKSNNQAKLIADLFLHRGNTIKCVVLQGCYSENQAREIVRHIEYVIGISQEIEDNAVIDFLVNFYYHVGSKWSIEESYDQSLNHLQRNGGECLLLPIILNKYEEQRRKNIEDDLKLCILEIDNNQNDVKKWSKKADLLSKLGRSDEAN